MAQNSLMRFQRNVLGPDKMQELKVLAPHTGMRRIPQRQQNFQLLKQSVL
jgi:hypothetical protein